ncbi:helix-turn-helix domain-containing protein [Kitasatospora sp. P5_F3]
MSETAEPSLTSDSPSVLSNGARALYLTALNHGGRLVRPADGSENLEHLDELLRLGLLVPDTDDSSVLIAIDPKQLSTALSTSWQRRALDLLSRAIALPGDLQDLAEAFHTPEPTGGTIQYIRGKVLINQQLERLVAGCGSEILTAQPGGPRPPEALAGVIERDLEALRRGVTLRLIYHPSTRYHTPTREFVAAITEHGARVRTLDESYTRLIIIDRRTAVIPVAGDLNMAAFVHDQAMVDYLIEEVFERNWTRGLDFEGSRAVPQQVISRLRQAIIDLLLKGTNHRVIARKLGISERTLARHIAEMREDYRVESLFQLGYVLARTEPSPAEESDDFA